MEKKLNVLLKILHSLTHEEQVIKSNNKEERVLSQLSFYEQGVKILKVKECRM